MSRSELHITSLGSGSSGNAFFIESPNGALLIDQGFSRKELLSRMEKTNCDPALLRGALLTHEHGDHAKGSRVFCDTLNIPLYTTVETAMKLKTKESLPKKVLTFEPGAVFDIDEFHISSFPVSHDVDTVGFNISVDDLSIGFATDCGYVNENLRRQLNNCHALIIESNYDLEMLMNSNRSLDLKRRIFGFRGHLDNRTTFELLKELLHDKTQLLLLAHVSRECNDYDMLFDSCKKHLQQLNMSNIRFDVLKQDLPLGKYSICGSWNSDTLF